MSDPDTRLEHALRADDPPPRDPMFRIEVLRRRERAALRRRLLRLVVTGAAAAIIARLALAALDALVGPGPGRLALILAAALVLTAALAAPFVEPGSPAARWGARAAGALRIMPLPRLWR